LLYNFRGGQVIFFAKVKTEMFDHEKLHVYQLQLEFIRWVTVLMDELQQVNAGKTAEARRHLDRASLSILFNIAEGNGKRRQQTRAKFFDDARGSTSESAACLDALVAKNVCRDERVQPGKQMLERVFSMLTKLVERFDQNSSSSSSSSSKPSTTRRRTRTNEIKRSLGDSPRQTGG
jgi:four helix bundle protein